VVREDCFHVYHQYVLRTEKRDELRGFLQENQIATGVYYPISLHEQPCFKSLGYSRGDFPISEKAAKEVLALPVFAEMTHQQIHYVIERIRAFFA
jgi:dTDP-4-amino-4,6-dideoxygalactose transaminase